MDPPHLDDFEENLIRKGYKPAGEQELFEGTDHANPQNIYIDIKPLFNTFKNIGFQEESIVRIKLRKNKYIASIFVLDKNSTDNL